MPEADLSLLFLRPLNQLGKHLRDIRTMLNVSSAQINQTDLQEWIQWRGVKAEWDKVIGGK